MSSQYKNLNQFNRKRFVFQSILGFSQNTFGNFSPISSDTGDSSDLVISHKQRSSLGSLCHLQICRAAIASIMEFFDTCTLYSLVLLWSRKF